VLSEASIERKGSHRRYGLAKAGLILGAMAVFSAGATAGMAAQSTSSSAATATSKPAVKTVAAKKPASAASKAVSASGPLVKSYGSANAPIRMDIYTDYQCPSCKAFYEGTLKQLIPSKYITEGKVYLVHHDFPLQAHMYSGMAARWANAAARVGEFPEAEEALYDNQEAWGANGDIAKYISAAMPAADFKRVEDLVKSCQSPAPTSTWDHSNPLANDPHPCAFDYAVADDVELGYKVPVQATPTYVITNKGQKLPAGSGAVSWPILEQFFDSLLSQN